MAISRTLTPAVFTDVKTGTIDFGGSAGTDRYLEIVAFWDAANLGAQQYTSATIGGVTVPFVAISTSTVDCHAEKYALGSSAALDALTGVQTWTLTGTPTGVNWHTIITGREGVASAALYQSTEDAFAQPIDISADVVDGDVADVLVLADATNVWVFDAPLVEYRNVNPGGPPARVAAGEADISADATGQVFGGAFTTNTTEKLAFLTVYSPVAAANAAPIVAGFVDSVTDDVTGSLIGSAVN